MTIKINQPRCRQITNGDVIKTLFPDLDWRYDSEYDVFTSHIDGTHRQYFDASWWDAPYKEDKNE